MRFARFETRSDEETRQIAARVGAQARPGDVFLLSGDLGAGKTVFARGLVQALSPETQEVPSPTFTLVQIYEGYLPGAGEVSLWHFDLYRIKDPVETEELGMEDAFADGISLVEWPDRLGPLLPADGIGIHIETGTAPSRRCIVMTGPPEKAPRYAEVT